jgi:hypothetical protein
MATNNGKIVCYYRVSTSRQGKSGLGIEAQRQAVANSTAEIGRSLQSSLRLNPADVRTGRRWTRPWPRRGCTAHRSLSARSIG